MDITNITDISINQLKVSYGDDAEAPGGMVNQRGVEKDVPSVVVITLLQQQMENCLR